MIVEPTLLPLLITASIGIDNDQSVSSLVL